MTWSRKLASLSGGYKINKVTPTLQGCHGGLNEIFVKPFAWSIINLPWMVPTSVSIKHFQRWKIRQGLFKINIGGCWRFLEAERICFHHMESKFHTGKRLQKWIIHSTNMLAMCQALGNLKTNKMEIVPTL